MSKLVKKQSEQPRGDLEFQTDLEMGRVTTTDYTVYNTMYFLLGADKEVECSLGVLAGKCHLSVITLRKSIRRLRERGWISYYGEAPNTTTFTVHSERVDTVLRID